MSPRAATKVEEAIDLAEARSTVTCEICGEPSLQHGNRWVTTRFTAYAEGRAPVPSRSGFANIFVVERIVGKRCDVRHRRYDRETDSFIDVDPRSLGIEEE